MEKTTSVWKANLTNGLILGLISVVYTLVMYFLDLSFNRVQGYVFLLIEIVLLYFMLKSYRDNYLYGYIKYGQSVGAGVVIFVYYSIIAAIFAYILYKFIDPGLKDKQLAMVEEMLVKRGTPQQAIDASLAMQKKLLVPEIIALSSIFSNILYGTIMSLLVSAFIKKEGNPLIDIPENR
ncbi:MAG TPA: DUF4199 domain-containing protein [Bacteroidales bacterium]|nr:DUF4199 domain-containing protein [Bacteroidales bacterium]HOU95737.1 DUF4199 domain-containing protein [Bacteroidales bacterium]HQG36721.1 DUF4199 domain-containing protein [Bacteroidales bacterium]HQG52875.1 DUF4199 domain-containing protein [Bacteroidales bacterium]HQJ20194.1 DUF4199 domain-containing protein [Bacteroidales bacterium]